MMCNTSDNYIALISPDPFLVEVLYGIIIVVLIDVFNTVIHMM